MTPITYESLHLNYKSPQYQQVMMHTYIFTVKSIKKSPNHLVLTLNETDRQNQLNMYSPTH